MNDDLAFLGTGWAFPPAFAAGGADVAMASGFDDVHQSLRILFATVRGERVMDEDYGCDLHTVQFEEINQGLVNRLSSLITDAILLHEPRVTLDNVDVSEDADIDGLLLISIAYTIRTTNTRFNMVYPFYLNEATAPGA
jgi:phage baseplate assembly protein W